MIKVRAMASFGLLAVLGCSPEPAHQPVAAPSGPPAATATVAPMPAPSGSPLARLAALHPQVDFRRRQEMIWQRAQAGISLEKNDSIQTRARADARIVFRSGSELAVAESTLLVLDHDPMESKAHPEDRVVVNDGTIEGSTPRELWFLTSGGLIRLRAAEGRREKARAKVHVRKDRQLVVKVEKGEGLLVNPNREVGGAPEKVELGKGVQVVIPVKHLTVTPTQAALEASWAKLGEVAASPAKPHKAELEIAEPAEGAELTSDSVAAAGGVTGSGCRLLVNGRPMAFSEDLKFRTDVPLEIGANVIVFQLVRPDGGVDFKRRTVVRKAAK